MKIVSFLVKLVLFLLIVGFILGFLLADSTQATDGCLRSVIGSAVLLAELAPPVVH
jgi:hypothetical protein